LLSQSTSRLAHLRQLEQHRLCWTIRTKTKAKLADWLFEIVEVFDLDPRIAFLTLLHAETMEHGQPAFDQNPQGLLSGIFLLYTLLTNNDIAVRDVLLCADNSFTKEDLETNFVLALQGQSLAYPVVCDFLNELIHLTGLDQDSPVVKLMNYMAELSLLTCIQRFYSQSKISAALYVTAALAFATTELWPAQLEDAMYSWESLKDCLLQLNRLLHETLERFPNLSIVRHRYSGQSQSMIEIPTIHSFERLTQRREQEGTLHDEQI
jgi:hypothetical protein